MRIWALRCALCRNDFVQCLHVKGLAVEVEGASDLELVHFEFEDESGDQSLDAILAVSGSGVVAAGRTGVGHKGYLGGATGTI